MDLSENIKKYRKRSGLTQAEVAEKMGIASPNYTLLENGKTEMTISKLEKLAEVFGVSVGELLGLESVGKAGEAGEVEALKKEVQELKEKVVLQSKLISSQEDTHEKMKEGLKNAICFATFSLVMTSDTVGHSFIEQISWCEDMLGFEKNVYEQNLFGSSEKDYFKKFLHDYMNFYKKYVNGNYDLPNYGNQSKLKTLQDILEDCKYHVKLLHEAEKLNASDLQKN